MPKVKLLHSSHISFKCPGCGEYHTVPYTGLQKWTFNGDVEKPTLHPSLLIRGGHYAPGFDPKMDKCWCGTDHGFTCYQCHSWVRDGKIEFLNDCSHGLKGQTVDLPEIVE